MGTNCLKHNHLLLLSLIVLFLLTTSSSLLEINGRTNIYAGTPDSLQNVPSSYVEVQAGPSGPTAIDVQWKLTNTSVSEQVTSYVVRWNGEGETGNHSVDSTVLNYTINNLVPCTTYAITVQPNSNSGPLGEPGLGNAETAIQGVTPVASVTPASVNDTSHQLDVSWTLIKDIGRCPGYYKLTWAEPKSSEHVVQNNTSYSITYLDTWTTYTVCVDSGEAADNFIGKPKCANGTTAEDVPAGPPTNIVASGVTTDSLTVQWGPPDTPNGNIVRYSVTWSPDDGSTGTSETTCTITGLLACSSYTVTVSASTSKGPGPPGYTSNDTLPAAPDVVSNVTVAMVVDQSDSLAVTWTQAEVPGRCDITNNTVSWFLSSTGYPVDSVTLNPTENLTITGLDPWTTYQVCIKAANQGGNGPDGQCQNSTTDEDTPGPPSATTASALSPSSIKVSWEPPETPNGIIIQYQVEWSLDYGDTDNKTVGNNTTEYIVTGLKECTSYNFSVTAATKKGFGEASDTANITTPPKNPPQPNNVTCMAEEATVLRVTWSAPVTICKIKQYNVDYHGQVLWSNITDPGQPASSTVALIDLTHLVAWTHYIVCVETEIIGGLVGSQSCCEATTEQAAPESPTSLNLTGTNTNSVSVSWTPPEILNGNLTGYCLSWELGQKSLSQDEHYTTVGGLKADTQYNLTLQAVTDGIHVGKGTQLDVKTTRSITGVIIGSVVGALLVVAVAVVLFVYRNNVKQKVRKLAASRQVSNNGNGMKSTTCVTPDGLVLNEIPGGSSRPAILHPHFPPKSRGLEVQLHSNWERGDVHKNEVRQYIQYLEKDSQRGLEEEHVFLKEQSPQRSSYVASKDLNMTKNRFINILPFDHTRVKLSVASADVSSDYINASYIKDTQDRYYFIASQGPKPNTTIDFWRMVWELKVYTIVMLTNLRENGKNKCAEYWPTPGDPPLRSGSITITNKTEEMGDYHVVRYLVMNVGEKKRLVKQYHFNSWPDFGVPRHEHNLLHFLKEVRDTMTSPSKHIVVHCSAGVGRTGTFIGLWNLVDTLEANKRSNIVNIRRAVLDMRDCRPSMVQSQDQYLYLWKCVAAYLEDPQKWKVEIRIGSKQGDGMDNPVFSAPTYDNLN